jgi:predicted HD phosphohydrolase
METKNDIIADILQLFNEKGHSEYGGEAVTQLEHALQTATLARENNASDQLITAALLHDIGHLLHDLPNDAPLKGIDDVHENKAAVFLRKYFPEKSKSEQIKYSSWNFLAYSFVILITLTHPMIIMLIRLKLEHS